MATGVVTETDAGEVLCGAWGCPGVEIEDVVEAFVGLLDSGVGWKVGLMGA